VSNWLFKERTRAFLNRSEYIKRNSWKPSFSSYYWKEYVNLKIGSKLSQLMARLTNFRVILKAHWHKNLTFSKKQNDLTPLHCGYNFLRYKFWSDLICKTMRVYLNMILRIRKMTRFLRKCLTFLLEFAIFLIKNNVSEKKKYLELSSASCKHLPVSNLYELTMRSFRSS
jgi:hypothetical protein